MKSTLQFKSAILTCAIIVGGSAMAGDHGHGHGRDPAKHMEMMRAEFNLSEEQASQFKVIMEETHNEMSILRKDAHKKMKALLNAEQKMKFEEHHKNRMGKRKGMKEKPKN